ncbi:UvrD-helicase domain-containing protein [Myxacorys almedinensis]|uniref:AAA family ATPase n=1 Tax=Myxacorys almedinensis A TaxID=2690445 RepID=A0A8J7Z4R7_9CYAN|nr:AAA family ATPase [Myxacorys almedinensis]NDJ17831.1 AAA family ATPase [Myxacorys almedinensis A]
MQWIDFRQTVNQRLIHTHLDDEQNKAKNFNIKGHSLIRGVAGSGKSLILKERIEKIVEEHYEPVLVLSYNRFMKGWIETQLAQNGVNVECCTFHQWAYQFGYRYDFDRNETARQTAITLAEQSNLKYQAILVDEAQDFYDEWFQAVLKVLDPQTNSLFFVYDNAQSVYGQAHRRTSGWSWAKLGLEVVGRSQVFDLNYRNAPEILELAWRFIQPAIEKAGMKTEQRENSPTIDKIIEPKTLRSRSSGVAPLLLQRDRDHWATTIASQIKMALETHSESSIAVLVHPTHAGAKPLRAELSKALHKLGINHHAPMKSGERMTRIVQRPFVLVDSWNAVKGIEFDAVILAGIDWTNDLEEQDFEEKAGLYTAMTRARDHLILLYEEKSAIVDQIAAALSAPPQLNQA